METNLLNLELKLEHAQRDIEELKEIVIRLSHMVSHLQTQITDLIESK